nr:MAG: putative RNA-dependent RNA polymerase [Partitiviridae sp.]
MFENNIYDYKAINITQVTPPNDKLSFNIPNSNQKVEKIAYKAVKKVYGQTKADEFVNNYHRADVTEETVIADLLRNNTTGVPRCEDPSYIKALKHIKDKCKPTEPLKTIHFAGVRFYDLNKSGSVGLPYVNDKNVKRKVRQRYEAGEIESPALTKGNCFNIILEKERVRVHQIKDNLLPKEKLMYDTRMHARSHLTDPEKNKVRAVYGVFCTIIFVEIMLLWPLIAHLRSFNSMIAWGYETFKGGLERLKQQVVGHTYHFSLDFSTFDKLLPFWLFDDIHDIWLSYYKLGFYYDDDPDWPNGETDPKRILNLWQYMNYCLKHMIYRAPDGSRYSRKHSGLPSGMLQTQLMGSFCNAIMVLSALAHIGIDLDTVLFKVLGDDGHFSIILNYSLSQKDLEKIALYCKKHFNAIVNVEKSIFQEGSESLQFLSYQFHRGAVRRVNDDLIGKLLYPEYAHFSVETTKSRALGIMIANLGYDPLVHLVCIDILEYLRDVELTERGLDWYDKQKLSDIISTFKRIPTRQELFSMARTPIYEFGDPNFLKYIR